MSLSLVKFTSESGITDFAWSTSGIIVPIFLLSTQTKISPTVSDPNSQVAIALLHHVQFFLPPVLFLFFPQPYFSLIGFLCFTGTKGADYTLGSRALNGPVPYPIIGLFRHYLISIIEVLALLATLSPITFPPNFSSNLFLTTFLLVP